MLNVGLKICLEKANRLGSRRKKGVVTSKVH